MTDYAPISSWAEDDRPREKLLIKGRQALSDAELIAILIGSGSRSESAVELSKRILQSRGHQLSDLGKMTAEELMQFKGIGEAKAITIMAAMELGRRRKAETKTEVPRIRTSRDVFEILYPIIGDLPHEEFWMVLLNNASRVLGTEKISSGGVTATVVDSRMVFKMALDKRATRMIVAHNHPSGTLSPSKADIALTQRLVSGGKLLDITVIDHLIITDESFYSFADEGIMPSGA